MRPFQGFPSAGVALQLSISKLPVHEAWHFALVLHHTDPFSFCITMHRGSGCAQQSLQQRWHSSVLHQKMRATSARCSATSENFYFCRQHRGAPGATSQPEYTITLSKALAVQVLTQHKACREDSPLHVIHPSLSDDMPTYC